MEVEQKKRRKKKEEEERKKEIGGDQRVKKGVRILHGAVVKHYR